MSDTQRNFLILGAIALVAVVFAGPGAAAIGGLSTLLNIAFVLMIGGVLWALHRDRAGTIAQMDSTTRLVLQGSGILFFMIFVTGTVIPGWSYWGGVFTLAFFVALAATLYGMYWAWQRRPGW